MFSPVSVYNILLGRGSVWPLPMMHWTSLYRPSPLYRAQLCPPPLSTRPWTHPPTSDIWWSRLDTCSNLSTWRPHCTSPPPAPPTSDDFWWLATYNGRAGGTHPTAFLSTFCFDCLFSSRSLLLHFCPETQMLNVIYSKYFSKFPSLFNVEKQ